MCQARVYLDDEEIMENVIHVVATPEGVRLATFFESPREVPAVIREIDLLKHRVVLESLAEPEAGL
jgi:predicted RNA-binding protein